MSTKLSPPSFVGHRAELLAESLFHDLGARFVAKPEPDIGYDYYVGFKNECGGINNYAVQVKASEKPVSAKYPLEESQYKSLAYSNIPSLLLVVDVKKNKFYYGVVESEENQSVTNIKKTKDKSSHKVMLKEIDDIEKDQLRIYFQHNVQKDRWNL